MLLKTFLQDVSNVFAENRLLKFVVVVQCMVLIWCVYKINDIKDHVRTIIVPPGLNSKVEVTGSWTSESYVGEYIRYIGALAWNYSPAVVRNQFEELLLSFHPDVYEDAKQRLYIIAGQVEQTGSASVFYINKVEHNLDQRLIEVTGNRRLTMQDKSVENGTKTYMVRYKVENSRFWVLGIEEKDSSKKIGAPAVQGQGEGSNVKR